jgi:ubiquinone/menaquinone biosynthesis C-methylase UbiE
MQWITRLVSAHHGQQGASAAPPTRGLVITSAVRYDLVLWLSNLMAGGAWQATRQQVLELAQLRSGETVLDVGCGTGTQALLAMQSVGAAGRVTGVDPSAQMIGRARRKAARRGLAAHFQVAAVEQLPFPDRSFDVALSTYMMHVLPDDLKRQGLAEVARVLKPGGRLLVVDFKRPEGHEGHTRRPVHTGPWQSGVQDQPHLMQAAGFVDIDHGAIETGSMRLPEIGFAIGRIPSR